MADPPFLYVDPGLDASERHVDPVDPVDPGGGLGDGGGGEGGGESVTPPAPPPDPQYVLKVRPHALLAHLLPPLIWRVVHAAHVTALATLDIPVSAVHAEGLAQEVPPPHSMWTVKSPEQLLELELVGVCLSAIMPSASAEVEYLTYMSCILLLWNAIFSIEVVPESSSAQLSSNAPFRYSIMARFLLICVQSGGCASVLVTKHANTTAQEGIPARCGTAARLPHAGNSCTRLAAGLPPGPGRYISWDEPHLGGFSSLTRQASVSTSIVTCGTDARLPADNAQGQERSGSCASLPSSR